MLGRSFGRYRIVESLGEGGMGTVWKAEDDLLGRSVALKLLSARMADSDNARARLLREARAAGALDHPGIGTVFDAGEQDGEIYVAMRLVDGGTVADRIRSQGALNLLDAVRIAASAADALGHAHAYGILHRDVSARNLMLTKDGQVVVVDFGLALAEGASRLTQTGMAAGTAHYMAPEAIQGKARDRRSDVYSLGAVLYEMLTGAPPFESDRLETLVYATVHTPPSPPSVNRTAIPAELDRIVLKTIAKKPEDRYASMEALRDDLDALEASGTIPEDAASPTIQPRQKTLAPTTSLNPAGLGRFRSQARKKRVAMYGLAVLALGLAASGITWLVRRQSLSPLPKYASLAVLPFKNTSTDPAESVYLSDGISQTLINKLTQMSSLHVPPWNTVVRFRDPSAPVERLAADLRVDALLFGTIQKANQRIRGTVSIVDSKTGYQVWADEFDEASTDLFTLQNKIAIAAATKLLGKLSGKQAEVLAVPAAASIEAYEYFAKGSAALRNETQSSNDEALVLFHRAVELDPGYALAWGGIGAAHIDRYTYGWDGGLKDLAVAEDAFRRVLELDPNSLAARRGLVRVNWYRGKSEECLKQGKLIAASGATGTDATIARAEAYLFGGLPRRAIPLLRQVMEAEPENPAAPWFMTIASEWAGSYQETIDAGTRYLEAFGDDSEVHAHMAIAFESTGNRKEAEAHYRRSIELDPSEGGLAYRHFLAALLRQEGRLDEADRLMLETIDAIEAKLLRSPDNCWLRPRLGAAYGFVGDIARLQEEEARVRHDCGDAALWYFSMYGAGTQSVEKLRASLQAGNVVACEYQIGTVSSRSNIEAEPGFKQFVDERAAECKRLDALY